MKEKRPFPSPHRRPRPTQVPDEGEIEFVSSFVAQVQEERDAAVDAYANGDHSPTSWVGLLQFSSILWTSTNFHTRAFPRGSDPYDLITGTRIVALAQITSYSDGAPAMAPNALREEARRADAEGRYGIESGDATGQSPIPARPSSAHSTGDESLDALLAEAEDMLEQLTPAYVEMHRRVNTLRRFDAPPGRPEFDQIREDAKAAYSPLARIALKAELDRQTLLHQEEPSEARRRLIFSLARELSFSLALLAVAESHEDTNTLGHGMAALHNPQEITAALAEG